MLAINFLHLIIAVLLSLNRQKTHINEENNGIIYFSADNGNSWENTSKGIPQKVKIGLGGIASDNKILAIATKEYGVFIFNQNDSNWMKIPTEKQIIDANLGSIFLFKNAIYLGTQNNGIFYTNNKGKNWETKNSGIKNLVIRRFFEFENTLYVCTNDGFYSLNEKTNNWQLIYSDSSLQVNGATFFKDEFYLATNKGVFRGSKNGKWINVLPNQSVHNVSADGKQIFAMTYTTLLNTSIYGTFWQNEQNGLPKNLYTFNVLNQNNELFAGQWDGIYKKKNFEMNWNKSSIGLPEKFAATNLLSFKGILVITTSERKLKSN